MALKEAQEPKVILEPRDLKEVKVT